MHPDTAANDVCNIIIFSITSGLGVLLVIFRTQCIILLLQLNELLMDLFMNYPGNAEKIPLPCQCFLFVLYR